MVLNQWDETYFPQFDETHVRGGWLPILFDVHYHCTFCDTSNQDQFLANFGCTIPKRKNIIDVLLLTLKTPGRRQIVSIGQVKPCKSVTILLLKSLILAFLIKWLRHTVRSRYQPCCTIYRNSPSLQFLTYSLAFSFKFLRIIWSYYNAIHLGHMWLNQGENIYESARKEWKTLKIL